MPDPLTPHEGYVIPYGHDDISAIELEKLLGGGGYGTCYLGRNIETAEKYAVKIFQNVEPGTDAKRIQNEATVDIDSEFVVKVASFRKWDDTTYLILYEYHEAEDLDKVIEELNGEGKTLSDDEIKSYFRDICYGLYHAHKKNIVHRDVKPANHLVSVDGKVLTIDFGCAKFKDRSRYTVVGSLMGTEPYIPPEIWADGAKDVEFSGDIYSLGMVLYEMAKGERFWKTKEIDNAVKFVEYISSRGHDSVIIKDDVTFSSIDGIGELLEAMTKIEANDRIKEFEELVGMIGMSFDEEPLYDVKCKKGGEIEIISGENEGGLSIIHLEIGESKTMGRKQIAADYKRLSREHVEFRRTEEGMEVRDLGSTNSTWLDGDKLEADEWSQLNHKSALRLDDVFIEYRNI